MLDANRCDNLFLFLNLSNQSSPGRLLLKRDFTPFISSKLLTIVLISTLPRGKPHSATSSINLANILSSTTLKTVARPTPPTSFFSRRSIEHRFTLNSAAAFLIDIGLFLTASTASVNLSHLPASIGRGTMNVTCETQSYNLHHRRFVGKGSLLPIISTFELEFEFEIRNICVLKCLSQ